MTVNAPARRIAHALAIGCVAGLTLPGAVAVAEPPPEPAPSISTEEAATGDTLASALSLQLSPPEGEPGTSFTAMVTKTGIDRQCTVIVLSWAHGTQLAAMDLSTNTASATFSVPDSEAGDRPVSASCVGATPDTAEFTVLAPTLNPSLTLDRPEGPPGAEITASGAGFACGGSQVRLVWDDGTTVTTASGSFRQPVTGPSTTGAHRLTASCTDNPEIAAEAPFNVKETPTQTPVTTTPVITPTDDPVVTDPPTTVAPVTEVSTDRPPDVPRPPADVPRWVIALFVLAAVLAAAGYRNWRKLQTLRVRAVLRPDGQPTTTLHEAPGQRTHAIRVRVDAGTAQHTIERGGR